MRILTHTLLVLTTLAPAFAGDEPAKSPAKAKHHAAMLAKYDANKDGKLDDGEKAAMRAAISARIKDKHPEQFATFDANHDGVLSKDELKALREARKAQGKKPADG